jgi:UDP-2,4-diacetamido-2,4,6-trideoxy-beta-L-altropyranose hydrolase
MKIIFRVDASIEIGTGHVIRCLTLAQSLKDKGSTVEFICRKYNGNLIDKIQLNGFYVYKLEAYKGVEVDNKLAHSHWLGLTQQQDADDCVNMLKDEKIDWIIVDHYALDYIWHKKIRSFVDKIMVIDDLADRNFNCNMLLNQNLGAKKEDYKDKVSDGCELLLGTKYSLLRPEFSNLREEALIKRKNTKEIKNILISMGGSDVKNITYDVLQSIGSGFNMFVVLGKKSPHNHMILNYAKNKKNIKVIIDTDNMAQLMLIADLAIGAGGSTSWERCCLGLPTLLFITGDNEKIIACNLERLRAVKIVNNLITDLQLVFNDFNLWKSMSNNAKNICDGLGVSRVNI